MWLILTPNRIPIAGFENRRNALTAMKYAHSLNQSNIKDWDFFSENGETSLYHHGDCVSILVRGER